MCHNVYIATSRPQIVNREEGWVLKFNLQEPTEYALPFLKDKFSLPHIYFVGSTSSCSCDLHASFSPQFLDDTIHFQKDMPPERIECLQSFFDCLKIEAQLGDLELYSCWDGDEELPIEQRIDFPVALLTLYDYLPLPMAEKRFFSFPKT